jgi:DNA-binding CsgD family transcriptional regulator
MEIDYYNLWKEVYEKEKNYKLALEYATKILFITDSIYEQNLNISFAGMEKKYKFQKLEITNQKLIIRNKKIVLYFSFSLFAFIILIVLFLYWRLKQKRNQLKIQNQLLLNEKKLFELEKQKFQQEHENSILLEKQLKIQQLLLANIENHKKKSLKLPVFWKENSHEINSTFNQELIACMDLEFNNITKRLVEKHPILSSRDILICCLLLANFDTGTIATVMDLKIESISKLRYRLRSKLQLDNSVNLLEYLRQF